MTQMKYPMKEDHQAHTDQETAIEMINKYPAIALDDKAYDAFIAALDAPVESNVRLKERVAHAPLWER